VENESNDVTPASMLAARILMMSLVARYCATWLWRGLVQVRTRFRLSAESPRKVFG